MSAIQKIVKGNAKLPSMPAVAIRILEAVKKDDSSFDELAKIISSDPALTVRMLKIANSSFYTLPQKVVTIEKAIAILGVNTLKNIALSFVISKELRGLGDDAFDFNLFWKRAVTAAIAADLIAKLINHKSDDVFVSGLLQDIGVVMMYLTRAEDYISVIDEKKTSDSSLESIEKGIYGFDHQELGSEVLKTWGFPENIYEPIRYHHKEGKLPVEYEKSVHTLFLSDRISAVYHGSNSIKKISVIKEILGAKYEIDEGDIENLIDHVAKESIEIFSMFEIDSEKMKPYSQILQEANEELGKLNLSNEQLIVQLKEEKELSANLARDLREKNNKLREMALKDGLTGLYNHKYFQNALDEEFTRAVRYRRWFSLVMFDLDHFKKVNDSYGHRAGDVVLQKISALVQKMVRENDIVARYGGEEFTIILPETDLKGGAVIAERIRKAVEELEISADNVKIKATISVGLATFVTGGKVTRKVEILDAADAALYNAKNSGRNKLSIAKL